MTEPQDPQTPPEPPPAPTPDETFTWTDEAGGHGTPPDGAKSEPRSAGWSSSASGAGAGANSTTILDSIREAVDDLAERATPTVREISARAAELTGNLGRFAMISLSATTASTASAILDFFMLLYTLFFLLLDGPALLRKVTSYLPLHQAEKELVLDKFVSVTRATLRGTLVIGVIQGTLGGLAFWAVGIDGALFWGTVMVVLSVLPVVGGALVWVPAAIVLALQGEWQRALGLTLFCALIVGSVDNVLRPRLVGRDTEMHDLMILFSTLGGIAAFGPMGFIIGPILAAVFITSWEIFGTAFSDVIPVSNPILITDQRSAPGLPATIVVPEDSEDVPPA
jgi:predicted PurR-regulated permease PerM